MKKLLLTFMVFSFLSSCGKDNRVTPPVAPLPPITDSSALSANNVTTRLLYSINSSETFFAKVLGNPTYYKFTTYTRTTNCKEKEGWFNIEYTSCKTDNISSVELIPINTLDLEKKRQELRDIVASSSQNIEENGNAYRITANNGSVYVIHRGAPFLANPTSVKTLNGSSIEYSGVRYNP